MLITHAQMQHPGIISTKFFRVSQKTGSLQYVKEFASMMTVTKH